MKSKAKTDKSAVKLLPSPDIKNLDFNKSAKYRQLWRTAFLKIKSGLEERKGKDANGTDNDRTYDSSQMTYRAIMRAASMSNPAPPPKKFFIHPLGEFYLIWTLLTSSSIVYILFWPIFFSAFSDTIFHLSFEIFDGLIDALFVLDFFLQFNLAYYNTQNKLVTSRLRILKHYLRTWFLFDLFSSMPFTTISLIRGNYSPVYLILKTLRIRCFSAFVKNFVSHDPRYLKLFFKRLQYLLASNSRFLALLKIIVPLIITVHSVSCLLLICARFEEFSPTSWISVNKLHDESKEIQYLSSLYWTITTLTTVGYGDVTLVSFLERSLGIMWMVVGIFVFSLSASSLTSFYSRLDSNESFIYELILKSEEFFKYARIPKKQRYLIKRSIRLNPSSKKKPNLLTLMQIIPLDLKLQIAKSLHSNAITKITFFSNKSNSFVANITLMLDFFVINSGENLWQNEEIAESIYFLVEGRMQYVWRAKPFLIVSGGQYIGDFEIFYRQERRFTMNCKNTSKVFRMNKSVIGFIKENYGKEYTEMKRASAKRYRFVLQHLAEIIGFRKYQYFNDEEWSLEQLKQAIHEEYDSLCKGFLKGSQRKRIDLIESNLKEFSKRLKSCNELINQLKRK